MTVSFDLNPRAFAAILAKTKQVEIRITTVEEGFDYGTLCPGDQLLFTSRGAALLCGVESIAHYPSVRALLQREGTRHTLSSTDDLERGVASVLSFPGYAAGERLGGAYALRLALPAVHFRPAGPPDAPCIASLRRLAWAETYRGIYPDAMLDDYDLSYHEERERGRLADPAAHCFLMEREGEPVGYLTFGPPRHFAPVEGIPCLNSLYILSKFKRCGIGRAALMLVAQLCRQDGFSSFFNGCNLHNVPARRFYEAMGGTLLCEKGGHDNPAQDQCYYLHRV